MSIDRRRLAVLEGLALIAVLAVLRPSDADAAISGQPKDRVLRVYNNNIENLVRNNADGSCTRVSGTDHLKSMLVDDAGRTGTSGVVAPDLLIVQQVRGMGQAKAYADQLSTLFGLPEGTYKAIVAWDDPERWGGNHHCSNDSLGDLKKQQTNGIIYNSGRLLLDDISKYWSAGWVENEKDYKGGTGCKLYRPPNTDSGENQHKWKRTSAIAARFTIRATGSTVFAATMHLPEENRKSPCAGDDGYTGIKGTGIHIGADATSLMNASAIRIVGIDANREHIPATTLSAQGLTGYGTAPTTKSGKIDYLFVRGAVHPSPVDYTVGSTKSNHLALYAFIDF